MMNLMLFDNFMILPIIFFVIFGIIFVVFFVFAIVNMRKNMKKSKELQDAGKDIGSIIKEKLIEQLDGESPKKKYGTCDYCGSTLDETGKCPNCGARKN